MGISHASNGREPPPYSCVCFDSGKERCRPGGSVQELACAVCSRWRPVESSRARCEAEKAKLHKPRRSTTSTHHYSDLTSAPWTWKSSQWQKSKNCVARPVMRAKWYIFQLIARCTIGLVNSSLSPLDLSRLSLPLLSLYSCRIAPTCCLSQSLVVHEPSAPASPTTLAPPVSSKTLSSARYCTVSHTAPRITRVARSKT